MVRHCQQLSAGMNYATYIYMLIHIIVFTNANVKEKYKERQLTYGKSHFIADDISGTTGSFPFQYNCILHFYMTTCFTEFSKSHMVITWQSYQSCRNLVYICIEKEPVVLETSVIHLPSIFIFFFWILLTAAETKKNMPILCLKNKDLFIYKGLYL